METLRQMYDLTSSLFIYKFEFIIQLYVLELIFGVMLVRRKKFLLRAAVCLVGLLSLTFLLPIVVYESWYLTVLFVVMFIISVLAIKALYAEPWGNLLVCGVLAYTLQHLSYAISNFIVNLSGGAYVSVYGKEAVSSGDVRLFVTNTAVYLLVCAALAVFAVVFSNKQKKVSVDNVLIVSVAILMIVTNVVLNAVVVYQFNEDYSPVLLSVYFVYDAITAAMVVWLLLFAMTYNNVREKVRALVVLREKEMQIYAAKKERAEATNVMLHDLKQQLNLLRRKVADEAAIGDMERSISQIKTFKTGNSVLDLILTENSAYCATLGINMTCMADGSALSDFSDEYVYPIFDNLLTNAIEGAKTVKKSARFVSVSVMKSIGGIVTIKVENSFDGRKLVFEDGFPKSTKRGNNHGYGLKSVKMAVDGLDGAVNVAVKDDVFKVSIVLPIK